MADGNISLIPYDVTTSLHIIKRDFKSPPIHRTPEYRAMAAYYGMLARCKNANGKNPTYVNVELRMMLDEWLEWSVPRYEEFCRIFPDVSPSVSRYGDLGHYEIGNIEIIPLAENASQQRSTCRLREDGTKPCSRCHQIKSAGDFGRKSSSIDGLDYWCKRCKKESWISYRSGRTGRTLNPMA